MNIFFGCEKNEIVSVSDENKQVFHLEFKAEEKYLQNKIVGNHIRVIYEAINTLEVPTVIVNNDTLKGFGIDSTNKKLNSYATYIPDAEYINFQILGNGKITKGLYKMPEHVKNLTCNGFRFLPILELANDSLFYSIETSADSNYTIKWDNVAEYYSVKLVDFTVYQGIDTQFVHQASATSFGAGKPTTIIVTSYKDLVLQTGDKPNFSGTYGSGYVVGSRAVRYRYEPQ
jgi:hypothetical protein